jgi:hypothetical protein
LYAHNVNVDAKNREALQVLPGQVTVFEAFDNEGGGPKKKVGTTGGKQWDPFSECRALKRLELKVGAQVMLLCNMRRADLSALGCYVPAPDGMSKEAAKEEVILANGAVGRVVSISGIPLVTVNGQVTSETEEKWPVVHFPGYKGRPDVDVRLQRHRWEKRDGPRDEHPATREQLPLALAYALSIHKSQGELPITRVLWYVCV